jgi:hypothetical protein
MTDAEKLREAARAIKLDGQRFFDVASEAMAKMEADQEWTPEERAKIADELERAGFDPEEMTKPRTIRRTGTPPG